MNYYPMAVIKEDDGKYRLQSTYDSTSEEGCRNQLKIWKRDYHYNIVCAWMENGTEYIPLGESHDEIYKLLKSLLR